MSQEILAVILGGGAGTRLYPLTASRSKPAVPIAGKYRLVDIPIVTIPVTARDASDFGIMKKNDDGYIATFIEKPKKDLLPDWESDTGEEMKRKGKIYLASMGIYIFSRQMLFDLLQSEYREGTDFGKEIIPQSIKK